MKGLLVVAYEIMGNDKRVLNGSIVGVSGLELPRDVIKKE